MNLSQQLHHNSKAKNWRKYWTNSIKNYLGKNTLEVGSGEGGNVNYLLNLGLIKNLTSLEPDKKFFKKLKKVKNIKLKILKKKIYSLGKKNKYDCILYADVLEHIKLDRLEILTASKYLKKGGRLIIMSPSHNFVYSDFDKAVNHYRRYNKKMLVKLKPSNLFVEKCYYLDSLGLILLIINKFFLKKMPKYKDIYFWDRFIVPISIFIDAITFYIFGKSIVCVFQKKI
tara:strand:- start:295 stop:978 length:684 start_codon:yes stop_codon:yes gene_type:complete